MTRAFVGPVHVDVAGDVATARAELELGGVRTELYWSVRGASIVPAPEAFVGAALLAAMTQGWPVEVSDPISARWLSRSQQLMRIYRAFNSRLRVVPVHATARPADTARPRASGVGLFFSGGVDGFHGLVSRMQEVTHLILIYGFDFPLKDRALGAMIGARLAPVAAKAGKTLVQVESNFHEIVARFPLSTTLTSMQKALGAGLGGIAALLSGEIGRVYVPSSATAATLVPFGSHPLVDPLWSTEELDVVHDAIEVDRYEKVQALANYPPAWEALRPCGTNEGGAYNCGKCFKCAWTMFMLEAAGALGHFKVFPLTLEQAIKACPVRVSLKPTPGHWYQAIQHAADDLTAKGPASEALRRILRSRTLAGHFHRSRMRRGIKAAMRRMVSGRAAPSSPPAPPPPG